MGIKKAQIDKMKCHIPKEKINTSKRNNKLEQNISIKYMVMDYTTILSKTHK